MLYKANLVSLAVWNALYNKCSMKNVLFTGDGNIHINVALTEFNKEVLSLVEKIMYEEVAKLNGSISAEHGIGFYKSKYIHYSQDESALHVMRELKQLMDPNGILNPYKVLPEITK